MMGSSATALEVWADRWCALMLAVLWQSTVLAVIVAATARIARHTSPAIRYWLWQVVAIKLLLMPLWSLSVPLTWPNPTTASSIEPPTEQQSAPVSSATGAALSASETATATQGDRLATALWALPVSWNIWLMISWALIVGGQAVFLVWQSLCLVRFLGRTAPAKPALQALVEGCARKLDLMHCPRVVVSEEECSPFVCGLWRPTLVIPRSLAVIEEPRRLTPVLFHELAHVKRRDLLWNWLPQLARMFYFFHPVAHWMAFRVRLEGELACDGWAMVASGSTPGEYADVLLNVVSRLAEPAPVRAGPAVSAGFVGDRH